MCPEEETHKPTKKEIIRWILVTAAAGYILTRLGVIWPFSDFWYFVTFLILFYPIQYGLILFFVWLFSPDEKDEHFIED